MATRVYLRLDALRALAERNGWTKPGGRDRLNATAIADAIGVNVSTVTRIIAGDPCGPATISGLLAVTDAGFDDLFTRDANGTTAGVA
jgi:hypothetical protein